MVGNIDRPAFSVFELNVDAIGRTDRSGCPTAIKNARATEAGLAAMTLFAVAAGQRRSIFS